MTQPVQTDYLGLLISSGSFPWILLGIAIFILIFIFKDRITGFKKTEKGFELDLKEDDEGKIVHDGKQYVNAELLSIYTGDQIDKTYSEINRTLVDMRQQSELSFESEIRYAEERWKVITYYMLDKYGQTIATSSYGEVEKKLKFMEMSLKVYWHDKLHGQFIQSFKKNGFHTYKKVDAAGNIVETEMWSNFLERIVSTLFHDFRHYIAGKYSFQPDIQIQDLLESTGFQVKKGENWIPGPACLDFIREIYDNSWQCQEESRIVSEDLLKSALAKRDALKLKLVIKG